jgi:PAS domain S-box-containing protein
MTPGQTRGSASAPLPDVRLLWRPLVESVECHVAVIDRERRILFLNRCTEGYESVEDVLGRDMLDFVPLHHQGMVHDQLEQVFSLGRTIRYELTGTDPAGVEACYAVRAAPVAEEGRVVAAVVTAFDTRRLSGIEASLVAERVALRKLIETQERERQLVSYEIHDGLAQYLASALMRLEACAAALAAPADSALPSPDASKDAGGPSRPRDGRRPTASERDCEEGLRLLRAALVEARRLINGLRPPMLDELGIVEAIESLVSDARIEVPEVVFRRPQSLPRLPSDLETTIFRIVQEALTNVRKHASADRVTVTLEAVDTGPMDGAGLRGASMRDAPEARTRGLRVAVADDGRGFDPAEVSPECFGLEGIRQRARLCGSEAAIRSPRPIEPDGTQQGTRGGTLVEVVLPLPAQPAASRERPER